MILNKTQKQELLTKHAKFFAADKNAANKIFQGIHYLKDGTAVVSDTHTLLRIKEVSSADDASSVAVVRSIHAITGAELEGVFPSNVIENLLTWNQENQMTLETTVQIEIVTKYARIAQLIEKELKSYDKIVKIALNKANAFLQVSDQGVELNVHLGELAKDQDETWSFNADYLYNAFNLFKSAKSGSIVIKFRHQNNAIVLRDEENGIDVLILPIRTNAEVRDACS
ncbi:MAG: hypothetical protein ACYCVD_04115 [Desulfitobacteriaceae bacterium]